MKSLNYGHLGRNKMIRILTVADQEVRGCMSKAQISLENWNKNALGWQMQ